MSGFQPGRNYIAGLNQIAQHEPLDFTQDDYQPFDDNLSLFINTEFIENDDIIDFDLDFDFTQAIPGEEEYFDLSSADATATTSAAATAFQAVQATPKTLVGISSRSTGVASSLPLTTPPHPSPHSVIPGSTATATTTSTALPSTNTSSNKKQKLSPRSSKPVIALSTALDTATTLPFPSSSSSLSPSSSSSISVDNLPSVSALTSTNSAFAGTKSTLNIIVPAVDSNPIPLPSSIPGTTTNTDNLTTSTSTLEGDESNNHRQLSITQSGNGDMNFDGDFHFNDIGFAPQGSIIAHNIPYAASASGYDYNIPPQSPFDPNNQLNTPVTTPPNGVAGVRPQGILPDAAALLEASSRAAAEEDKRRRNTAASARFRFKKKQREQALERSAHDMTDKLDKLEDKINQLEKENAWLRSLVVERTAKTSEEMTELYKTFKDEERSKESHKKGVGTLKTDN